MTDERRVLASCLNSKLAAARLRPFLDRADFSAAGWLVMEEILAFYDIDPEAAKSDKDIILGRIRRRLASPKQADAFTDILNNLSGALSSENVALDYLEQKRTAAGDRLAGAIGARSPAKDIKTLADEFETLRVATELDIEPQEAVEADWEALIKGETDLGGRIKVLPTALNARLGGGLRRGDCLVLLGRPNSGKSLFGLNASAGFVKQGLKVLWLENEDRGNRTKLRFACRLLEVPAASLAANPAQARTDLLAVGADRFVYRSLTPGTVTEIEDIIIQERPDIFVVNQVRNLVMPKCESLTILLDKASQRLRVLGKKYGAICFLITQASAPPKDYRGDTQDKPVLYMEDVDSSRTGLAAAADVMIGYGTSRDLRESKMACLNIAKNKNGPEEIFYVRVLPEIDKLVSVKEGK